MTADWFLPVVIVVPLTVVALVGIFAVCCVMYARQSDKAYNGEHRRDSALAPRDEKEKFAIVFTDIQGSTVLWAKSPEHMGRCLDLHHATIRDVIQITNGYEVKVIGDSFMVAFRNASDAVDFALEVQARLHEADWGTTAIDNCYAGMGWPTGQPWNGLRVRIGIDYGLGNIRDDSTAGHVDYYGMMVNRASRVENVGHGGQTLVTEDVWAEIGTWVENAPVVAEHLQPVPLKGIDGKVALTQLLPGHLSGRTFPPLRLDAVKDTNYDLVFDGDGNYQIDVDSSSHESSAGKQRLGGNHTGSLRRDNLSSVVIQENPESLLQDYVIANQSNPNCASQAHLMSLYNFLCVLFSTYSDKERSAEIDKICHKWHIDTTKSRGKGKADVNTRAMKLVLMVAPIVSVKVAATAGDSRRGTLTGDQLGIPGSAPHSYLHANPKRFNSGGTKTPHRGSWGSTALPEDDEFDPFARHQYNSGSGAMSPGNGSVTQHPSQDGPPLAGKSPMVADIRIVDASESSSRTQESPQAANLPNSSPEEE